MRIRVESIVGLIFFTCGVGVTFLGFFLNNKSKEFAETAVPVSAVISEIESYRDSDGDISHRSYVTFEFGGKVYEDVSLGYYSSSMREGKKVEILCDPYDPYEIQSPEGMDFAFWMCLGMGAIFAVVGGSLAIAPIFKKVKDNKLMETGKTIWGVVESVGINTHYSVNGEYPWVLYCRYEEDYSGKIYRFKSDNLWFDPGFIYNEGDSIQIIVDPSDYSKHKVVVDESKMAEIVDYT